MTSLIRHVTIDSADPYAPASFWAQALDGSLADDDFPGDPEAVVTTTAATLLFVQATRQAGHDQILDSWRTDLNLLRPAG